MSAIRDGELPRQATGSAERVFMVPGWRPENGREPGHAES